MNEIPRCRYCWKYLHGEHLYLDGYHYCDNECYQGWFREIDRLYNSGKFKRMTENEKEKK